MGQRSGVSANRASGGSRWIDLCVIAAAGLFFVNIVVGNASEDDQMLFLAAEIGAPMLAMPIEEPLAAHPG